MKYSVALIPALTAIIAISAVASDAPEKGYSSVWLNGSYTDGKHPGGGFGFHSMFLGAEVSFLQTGDYPSDSVYVIPPDLVSNMGKSDPIGRKKIDGALGIDFMLITLPYKHLSAYVEGGIYYQETQDVFRSQSNGQLWSTHHNYGAIGGYGGGIMYKIPANGEYFGFNGINLLAGYHSIRGITAALGITY